MQSTYLPVGITVIWQKKWKGGGVRLSHYGAQGPREPTGVLLLSFDLENMLSLWVLTASRSSKRSVNERLWLINEAIRWTTATQNHCSVVRIASEHEFRGKRGLPYLFIYPAARC